MIMNVREHVVGDKQLGELMCREIMNRLSGYYIATVHINAKLWLICIGLLSIAGMAAALLFR